LQSASISGFDAMRTDFDADRSERLRHHRDDVLLAHEAAVKER
jgi:hypothetical protein